MIKIGERYIIEAAPECYSVKYLTGNKPKFDKKTGKTSDAYDVIGYFGTIENCIMACSNDAVKRKVMKNDYSLSEAVKMIAETTSEFKKYVSDATKGA